MLACEGVFLIQIIRTVNTIKAEIDLPLAEEGREFRLVEWQCSQLRCEWRSFQQSKAGNGLHVVRVLLYDVSISILVTASQQNLAAVVVVEVKLKLFSNLITRDRDIDESEECPRGRESFDKLLHRKRTADDTGEDARLSQEFDIRIHADHDLGLRRQVLHSGHSPLGDLIMKQISGLLAPFQAGLQKIVVEDDIVAVDEDENMRVAIHDLLHVRGMRLVHLQILAVGLGRLALFVVFRDVRFVFERECFIASDEILTCVSWMW